MKKIPSVFQRNYETDRLVRNEVVPGSEWVIAGEGIATRKYDGACCMARGGELFKRYELKAGKNPPFGFIPAQEADHMTGNIPGWLPIGDGPEDKWFRLAFESISGYDRFAGGTFEAIGPHFGGGHHEKNPEGALQDVVVKHGSVVLGSFVPRDFDGLREYLLSADMEGIVFHHPDGRMAKVKKKDFGFKR